MDLQVTVYECKTKSGIYHSIAVISARGDIEYLNGFLDDFLIEIGTERSKEKPNWNYTSYGVDAIYWNGTEFLYHHTDEGIFAKINEST
jgi:hypothetical protein